MGQTENWIAIMREANDPERYLWLSFCDDTRPKGSHFLGATVVKARGTVSASRRAWELGINPGGEMLAVAFDNDTPEIAAMVAVAFEKLCSRADLEAAGVRVVAAGDL